tara:strand:+ start:1272 stop:1664 length:393 start_codon:yes stop_codon:yes gene_type:complete
MSEIEIEEEFGEEVYGTQGTNGPSKKKGPWVGDPGKPCTGNLVIKSGNHRSGGGFYTLVESPCETMRNIVNTYSDELYYTKANGDIIKTRDLVDRCEKSGKPLPLEFSDVPGRSNWTWRARQRMSETPEG